MPVLPAVGSTISDPFFRRPRRSASTIIRPRCPPRSLPPPRKPRARGPSQYPDRLLADLEGDLKLRRLFEPAGDVIEIEREVSLVPRIDRADRRSGRSGSDELP